MLKMGLFKINQQPTEADYIKKDTFLPTTENPRKCLLISSSEYKNGDEIHVGLINFG